MIFSLILLIATFFYIFRFNNIYMQIFCACASICSAVAFLFYYVADSFTNEGINDAVFYHIYYGLGGAGFSAYTHLIVSVITILIGIVVCAIYFYRNIKPARNNLKNFLFFASILLLSWTLNPALANYTDLLHNKLQNNKTAPLDNFSQYYHIPEILPKNSHPKNIVLIYAESFERTFFDENIFPNLATNLKKLEEDSVSFTNIVQVPNVGWSIAGIVASQCGIPLFSLSHGDSMVGMDQFLSSAVCLGDLLHSRNYQTVYYGGADLNFAGKGKFLKSHGFDEIHGKNDLTYDKNLEKNSWNWGVPDKILLDTVYKRFVELSMQEQPFILSLLTIDTHDPELSSAQTCSEFRYKNGEKLMLNTIACADHLISKFINKIKSSPFYKNTIIVVVSDHLAMKNDASELLEKAKERKDLFMILNSGLSPQKIDILGSTMDIGPTILPFLGFDAKIGLGRNLFQQPPKEEISYIHEHVLNWKEDILKFWEFPTLKKSIHIYPDAYRFKIDKRTFWFPALIQFDENFNTKLLFDFYTESVHKTLMDHVMNLDNDCRFILIHGCASMGYAANNLTSNDFCMMIGQGKKVLQFLKINKNIKITKRELENIFNDN